MELAMAILLGVMFASATYLILRPNLIRVVLGFGVLSNAVNLMMITAGGYSKSLDAPFVHEGHVESAVLMDPLPPDIILTAIVISFAVGALFLIVCYRTYLDFGTDNPQKLPQSEDPDAAAAAVDDELAVPDLVQELSQPDSHAPHESSHAHHATGTPAAQH